MPVQMINHHPNRRPPLAPLKRAMAGVMRHLGCARDDVSVMLVADGEMRKLNRDYRSEDHPTDILSFGMRERRRRDDPLPPHPEVLGDLVVSLDTVERQGTERGVSGTEELLEVLVHGLLHLLGYDHASPVEARRMFALQAALAAESRMPQRRRGRIHSR